MINSGVSITVVGSTLNHKSLKSTQVYARINQDSERESVQIGVDRLLKEAKVA